MNVAPLKEDLSNSVYHTKSTERLVKIYLAYYELQMLNAIEKTEVGRSLSNMVDRISGTFQPNQDRVILVPSDSFCLNLNFYFFCK